MEPNIGIENKEDSIQILSVLLSDLFVIYVRAYNFHWNVENPSFPILHSSFQDIYEQMQTHIDAVAERVRMLGAKPPSSLKEFITKTNLSEEEIEKDFDANQMVGKMLSDIQYLIKAIRKVEPICIENHDQGTSDLFIKMIGELEKTAWFLRSQL